MSDKTKIILRNDTRVNFSIPTDIFSEFEEILVIEKRKRGGKLIKKQFIIEVFKKGVREWFNQ